MPLEDRRTREATPEQVWARQLENELPLVTIIQGRAGKVSFKVAVLNQHHSEPNNLTIKKAAVKLSFNPEVRITGLRIREKMLLIDWKELEDDPVQEGERVPPPLP